MPTELLVEAGSCGFKAKVRAERVEKGGIRVKAASSCEKVRRWAERLGENLRETELLLPINENPVYKTADRDSRLCPPCPVPLSLLLAAWAEAGYMLKKKPEFTFKS